MKQLKSIFLITALIGVRDCYAQKNEIKPYIDFLEQQNTSAVDYVFELFDKNDIVILGERDHGEMTQYELVKAIITDNRFIDNVGHIFTEIGPHNQTESANGILSGVYEDYSVFEQDLIRLYRDLDARRIWEKYNFWYLLSTIYDVNTLLDDSRKLTIHFSDIEFEWDNYFDIDAYTEIYDRDSIIGHHFIHSSQFSRSPNGCMEAIGSVSYFR